jgi:hypothetical protein
VSWWAWVCHTCMLCYSIRPAASLRPLGGQGHQKPLGRSAAFLRPGGGQGYPLRDARLSGRSWPPRDGGYLSPWETAVAPGCSASPCWGRVSIEIDHHCRCLAARAREDRVAHGRPLRDRVTSGHFRSGSPTATLSQGHPRTATLRQGRPRLAIPSQGHPWPLSVRVARGWPFQVRVTPGHFRSGSPAVGHSKSGSPLAGQAVLWGGGGSAMAGAEGNSESHTKSVAWEMEFRARTAARRTSAHTSSEGIWRGMVGVRVGLGVSTKRCGPLTACC